MMLLNLKRMKPQDADIQNLKRSRPCLTLRPSKLRLPDGNRDAWPRYALPIEYPDYHDRNAWVGFRHICFESSMRPTVTQCQQNAGDDIITASPISRRLKMRCTMSTKTADSFDGRSLQDGRM